MTTVPDHRAGLRARALALLNARPSRRALAFFCMLWVAAMLIPLLAMSFYAYPTHDDFPSVRLAAEAWARTGSLWQTVKAAWRQAMYDYQTWQGTYVAMFLCAFQPMAFSVRLFWLTPFSVILMLALSAWYMTRQVTKYILKEDLCVCAALYAALMTLLFQYVPGIRELVYWQSATQYALSLAALMPLIGLIIRLHAAPRPALYAWRAFAAFLCAVALGGLPYPLALGGAVGMALATAWCFMRRSPARLGSLIAFLGILASLIAVVAAPGNAVRQERVGDSMAPMAAVVHSVVECLSSTAGWFGPQLIGLALVLAPLLWTTLKGCPTRFRNPGWFSLFSFGVLAAGFVPPIFATGVDSYKLDRILGSLYMLYALLVIFNLLYWLGWLAQRRDAPRAPENARVWQLGLCAALAAWGLFASGAVLATPTLGACHSLITGEAARYQAEMLAREEALLQAESLEQARKSISFLSAQPAVFPLDMLVYQSETALPGDMRRFFGMQRLAERYGAGRVPAEEWAALDAWSAGETELP